MRIGIGGGLGPLRVGVSNKGIGGGLGPLSVGTSCGRRRGGGGGATLIVGALMLAAVAAVFTVAFWAVAWPWYAGAYLAEEAGAGPTSPVRHIVGWTLEVLYAGAALAVAYQVHRHRDAREFAHQDAGRAEAAEAERQQRAEAARTARLCQISTLQRQVRYEADRVATAARDTTAISEFLDRINRSPRGAEIAGRSDADTLPAGTHVMGVLPQISLTAPRVTTRGAAAVQSDVDTGSLAVSNEIARFSGQTRSQSWPIAKIERVQHADGQLLITLRGRKTVTGLAGNTGQLLIAKALIEWAQAWPEAPAAAAATASDHIAYLKRSSETAALARSEAQARLAQLLQESAAQPAARA